LPPKAAKPRQIYAFRFWIEGGVRHFIFGQCLVPALVSGRDKVSPMDYASPRAAHESGEFVLSSQWGKPMSLDVTVVNPLIALIAGILILLMPRLLNYVVAIYLIVIGVLGLAHHFNM
jgi:DUF3096 family protein